MKNILVVDDSIEIVELVCEILEPLDAEIDVAYNGKVAFDMMMNKKYDVVVSDHVMPILTGLSLIENCKKLNLKSKFLLISGSPLSEILSEINQKYKPDSFLSKPFHTQTLFDIVEQMLE